MFYSSLCNCNLRLFMIPRHPKTSEGASIAWVVLTLPISSRRKCLICKLHAEIAQFEELLALDIVQWWFSQQTSSISSNLPSLFHNYQTHKSLKSTLKAIFLPHQEKTRPKQSVPNSWINKRQSLNPIESIIKNSNQIPIKIPIKIPIIPTKIPLKFYQNSYQNSHPNSHQNSH